MTSEAQTEKNRKDIAVNRQAFHNYDILDKFEAGVVLTGTEIKSAREGQVNLKDAYGIVKSGEVWLLNCHISPYSHGSYANHEPLRTRKLLLKRSEINRLIGRTTERGLTLVPLRVYLSRGRLKCELALAKGRKVHDKREVSRRKTIDKETRQAVNERNTR
ncbi:MAG: SsrA-binding protein [Acidobacteria bacterium]|nr:MAG: SsrA-binding protein [Acidobacteriota bacterium]